MKEEPQQMKMGSSVLKLNQGITQLHPQSLKKKKKED